MVLMPVLCFKIPRLKALVLFEDKMTNIFESLYHRSWTKKHPMSLQELHRHSKNMFHHSFFGPINVIEHWHEDGPVLEVFWLDVVSPKFSRSREEETMTKILGNFSSRILSVLRRVPLRLGTTNTSWDLQLDLSIFLLLLKYLSPVRHKERNQHRHIHLPSPYWSRPWWWWIFQAFHILNFFGMFFYEFVSDVEHIPDVLESCVLVDFRIRQEIRTKVDGGFHRRSHEQSPC